MRPLWRLSAYVALGLLFSPLPGRDSRASVPVPAAQVWTLDTEGGPVAAGRRLGSFLQSRGEAGASGRAVVAWPPAATWLDPLARGLAEAWPVCVLLSDLGASGDSEQAAYAQMDPASFTALLWMEGTPAKDGAIPEIDVTLHPSAQKTAAFRVKVRCVPPLRGPVPPSVPEFKRCAQAGGEVRAMTWEDPAKRLWIAAGGRLLRLDPATGKTEQSWELPPSAPGKPLGGAVLVYLPEEGAKPPRMGWFDEGLGSGRWYESVKGTFAPGGDLSTLPLPDRVLRFLTPSSEGPSEPILITSYQQKDLCRCVDFVRFSGPAGSCFACLGPGGGIQVVRGDSLAVFAGPSPDPSIAVAGAEHLLLAVSKVPPFHVKGWALAPGYTWQPAWTSPQLPAVPSALCAGEWETRPALFAAVQGGDILVCPLPETAR